mgnify:CR=1 FL=1
MICFIYSLSHSKQKYDNFRAYQKFITVFTKIHKNPATRIKRNGRSKETSVFLGKKIKAIKAIQAKLHSFPNVVESTLNSIFIEACIKARKDELRRENKVKIEIIVTPRSAREEL